MAFYHEWDVKNDFAYVLQFFSLIFDGLGGVFNLGFFDLLAWALALHRVAAAAAVGIGRAS